MPPESLVRRVAAADRILLSSHTNPDGDAIGSELGLARALEAAGKSVTIWNRHPTPTLFASLPGADRILVGAEPPAGFPAAFDLGIPLECPQLDRTGLESELARLPLVNIDHHLGNAGYGAENWVEPDQPACAVMVAELIDALGAPLDSPTANCLYVGLATDTGGFRFGNATPAAFDAAARLVRRGAEIERVSSWLYESQPEGGVRLLAEMLATLERHDGGRVASCHLTRAMFERTGALPGDSEGLIDTPRSIAGVECVVLLRETGPDEWKVSLRSRGAIDVQNVARANGGGGHRNAAGCRAQGELTPVRDRFVAALAEAIVAAERSQLGR